jgi:hypothetical protein
MYYIYHIIGVKIGCSNEPNRRVKQQGYDEFEILEQHQDIDIASEREKELQKQYGYRVDNSIYYISKNNRRKWKKSDGEKGRETMLKNGFFNDWYKKGNAARIKSVGKYDKKTEELICIYNSISDAARSIDRPNSTTTISSCCLGKRNSYMGYKWKYIE